MGLNPATCRAACTPSRLPGVAQTETIPPPPAPQTLAAPPAEAAAYMIRSISGEETPGARRIRDAISAAMNAPTSS